MKAEKKLGLMATKLREIVELADERMEIWVKPEPDSDEAAFAKIFRKAIQASHLLWDLEKALADKN